GSVERIGNADAGSLVWQPNPAAHQAFKTDLEAFFTDPSSVPDSGPPPTTAADLPVMPPSSGRVAPATDVPSASTSGEHPAIRLPEHLPDVRTAAGPGSGPTARAEPVKAGVDVAVRDAPTTQPLPVQTA